MKTIKSGIGKSNNLDAFRAGEEAVLGAMNQTERTADLIIVFSSINYDQEKVLQGVKSVAPDIPMAGGTPGWGIITREAVEEKGVAVMALKFEKTKVRVDCVSDLEKDAEGSARSLAEKLMTGEKKSPQLLLLFLPGVGVEIDSFLKGLKEKFEKQTNVLGGGTGDGMALKSGGCQFYNGRVLTNSAVTVGFWGDFSVEIKAGHGWEPLGLEMKITKAKGNLVSEIDKRPAIEIFERYFAKEEINNPKFFTGEGDGILYPLGIVLEEPERIIIRQVIGATPKGELVFATNMPEGVTVKMMQAQTSKMIEKAAEIGEIGAKLKKSPQLAFVFDCVTRKALLLPDHQKEIDAFSNVIGKDVPIFGYFSYGEFCSQKEEEEWLCHNETFTAGVLTE